jgi:hypothetical protein
MTRLLTLAATAFLALTGVAAAKDNGAHVYRAKLAPVAGASAPMARGQLVDGRRHNIVTIEVKGLTPGTSYPWHVHAFAPGVTNPCAPGATQGPIVSSFMYGTLTGDARGNGFAMAPSTSFDWGPATNRYYMNIHDPVTLAPIACGVLTPAKAPKPRPCDKHRGFGHSGFGARFAAR